MAEQVEQLGHFVNQILRHALIIARPRVRGILALLRLTTRIYSGASVTIGRRRIVAPGAALGAARTQHTRECTAI